MLRKLNHCEYMVGLFAQCYDVPFNFDIIKESKTKIRFELNEKIAKKLAKPSSK